MTRSLQAGAFSLCLVAVAAAEKNWPSWRGPDSAGTAREGSYPVTFSDTDNVRWKAELPGLGCSTPIVWEDHIIVTCAAEDQDAVVAYDFEGEQTWLTRLGPQNPGKHRNASGSNPSPVTDGETVFAYFKSGTLAALDFSGEVIWKTNLQEKYGPSRLFWDVGTSPVLTRDDVVVAVMDSGDSFLAAFDKKTGELHWKTDRNYKTPRENDNSYATPVVIDRDGRQVILTWGAEHLTAHDAADGKLIWECGGFNPKRNAMWPVCSSIVVAGDIAVVPFGRRGQERVTGVKIGGTGDVTETNRVWVSDAGTGTFVPTPSVADGKVYILHDEGKVECLDAQGGQTLWRGELPRRGRANFYGSPLIADGKLYAAREDGAVFVAELKDDGIELLAENEMGDRIIASPVPARDRLLIRSENYLFCVGAE